MPETVIFHPLARRELQDAAFFYEDQVHGLGSAFRTEVREYLHRIIAHPLRFSIRIADVRRANLVRFPYHLNYVIRAGTIAVVAVSHHQQRPYYWKDRLNDRRWLEE
jgi:hypothetical protein